MGIQIKLVRKLPRGIQHFPLDFTFVVLGIPSAFVSLLGLTESKALDEALPGWADTAWALTLLVGCVCWGIGVFSTRAADERTVLITRVPVMVLGLSLVSVASFVYGIALLLSVGWNGLLAAVPLLAFSFGTYIRRVSLVSRSRDGDE